MNNLRIFTILLICIVITNILIAQNDSILKLSLKDAIEFAKTNSPLMKNAQLDLVSAKKKIWETTAIGLPQVNAKFNYTYMLTVPDKIKEFSSFSSLGTWMYGADQALYGLTQNPGFGHIPDPGTPQPVNEKDMKWGSTLDLTATQLIFSGGYIVGLQTSKTFKKLSEIAITKSENDLKQNVASAYYLVLVANENAKVLDSTYNNTEKLKYKMEQMYAQGFIEETDVDQMKLTLSNLNDSKNILARQSEIALNLLKFQIGLDLSAKLELTEKIEDFVNENNINQLLLQKFDPSNTPDIQLLESQEKLSKLNVKFNQSAYLPDIAAFYTHDKNFNKNSFTFTPPDILGVAVNIPIFGSGMKHAKIQQAKIALEKTQNLKTQATQGLMLDFEKSKTDLNNSLDKFKTSKKNMQLSYKIQQRTIIKYKEGISSSNDITMASNQYLQSMANYFSAVMELLNAKSKIEKLLLN